MAPLIQDLARVALVLGFTATATMAVLNHGRTVPRRTFTAWGPLSLIAVEAMLIFLAGGWG